MLGAARPQAPPAQPVLYKLELAAGPRRRVSRQPRGAQLGLSTSASRCLALGARDEHGHQDSAELVLWLLNCSLVCFGIPHRHNQLTSSANLWGLLLRWGLPRLCLKQCCRCLVSHCLGSRCDMLARHVYLKCLRGFIRVGPDAVLNLICRLEQAPGRCFSGIGGARCTRASRSVVCRCGF